MESLSHYEQYERHDWLADDFHYLGHTAYREYPIQSLVSSDVDIYLEGRCYGREPKDNEKALWELADLLLTVNDGAQERLANWLCDSDGDFVALLFYKKTKQIFVINDIFGRLPLYYWKTSQRLILSRELRFVADFMNLSRFDKMGLAQHLLIGYPLGERTLLENVHRLPPATCIRINPTEPQIHIHPFHQYNCEVKADPHVNRTDNAAELAMLFARSCAARAMPNGKNVVSLSGGFDSRAIAACLHKTKISFCGATFLDPRGRAASDVAVARKVAALLHSEWQLFALNPPSARDTCRLLRMKNGLNPLYLSFLVSFLDQVKKRWGSDVVLFSGEVGDRILPDRRPGVLFSSVEELVNHLLQQDPKFSLATVSALTGLAPADIVDELHAHICSYPEQDWLGKYIHFVTYERIYKWLTEGEDRNRCFFGSATPYSGFAFFDFAMRCPDEQKSYYGLYREFLMQLSPAAAAIEHAGTGAAVTSSRFRTVRKTLAFLQDDPELRKRLQNVMGPPKGYDHDRMTMAYLRRQVSDGNAIFEYLSAATLRDIIDQPRTYTKEAIDLLFTLTVTIEDRLVGTNILETV
jgi:asparagine synthase (glutamine-hydrolysing)